MILDQQQIEQIIVENPARSILSASVTQSKDLRVHMYGTDLEVAVKKIEGFESDTMRALRLDYCRSNKDLMARLNRPIDKVFSAKGGSVYYNLSETQEKAARAIANNIRGGISIKKWIENVWRYHFLDDPNGVIMMEIAPEPQATQLRQAGKSISYPTYRPSSDIYDYLPNGNNIEYIAFLLNDYQKKQNNIDKDKLVYRVVDDQFDYFVEKGEGDKVTILNEYTLPNFFGIVPAILNSDIPNPIPTVENGSTLSIFDIIVDLANEFLVKGSIKITSDFRHAFPKYWEFADDCPTCRSQGVSTGLVNGKPCPDCLGSRKKLVTKASDVKLLSYPRDKESPIVVPNVAGYVSPDKTYQEIASSDLALLEELMNFTLWGAHSMQQTQGLHNTQAGQIKTATEIVDEIKPQEDRLFPITEAAERRHKFILDLAVKVQVADSYITSGGSFVNYGKRYMIESPDVLWDNYQNSRTRGASISALDDMMTEYYETKFSNDPIKLAISLKMMKVEPFVHATVTEIANLPIPEQDYKAKLFYSEWTSTLNQAMILSGTVESLRAALYTYSDAKILPAPEPATNPNQPNPKNKGGKK